MGVMGVMGAMGFGMMTVGLSPAPEPPPANAPNPPPRVDNHGDPLPDGAIARFGTTRFRRAGPYGAAVVRPDGKTFLDVDDSLLVRTYDSATGKLIGTKQLAGKGGRRLRYGAF